MIDLNNYDQPEELGRTGLFVLAFVVSVVLYLSYCVAVAYLP